MISAVSFIVMFSLLIFAHEFGHFITAKLSGVRVEEFGFGYPPRMVKLGTWHGTDITINWLPIGGFVRMSEDDPTVEGSLASKNRRTRALVYVAGALMNVVLAVVLNSATFVLGTWVGVDGPGAGVADVTRGSPAEIAGLKLGDTIVMLDGQTVQDNQQATQMIRAKLGQPLQIVVQRNGVLLPPIEATPRVSPPPGEGALGVALTQPLIKQSYPVWKAVPMGVQGTYRMARFLVLEIRALIVKEVPFQVSGPVGIYQETARAAQTGLETLLAFTAFLSLNLFMVNLLPLPALDGGRLIFVLLEWVRRGRKVPPEQEGMVHAVGMALLLGLMAIVTFFDIRRLLG
jgi:regulator of sigma E protease